MVSMEPAMEARAEPKSGSLMRSKVYFTASELKGVPSWKVTPSRSFTVTVRPSSEYSGISAASRGMYSSVSGSMRYSVS